MDMLITISSFLSSPFVQNS